MAQSGVLAAGSPVKVQRGNRTVDGILEKHYDGDNPALQGYWWVQVFIDHADDLLLVKANSLELLKDPAEATHNIRYNVFPTEYSHWGNQNNNVAYTRSNPLTSRSDRSCSEDSTDVFSYSAMREKLDEQREKLQRESTEEMKQKLDEQRARLQRESEEATKEKLHEQRANLQQGFNEKLARELAEQRAKLQRESEEAWKEKLDEQHANLQQRFNEKLERELAEQRAKLQPQFGKRGPRAFISLVQCCLPCLVQAVQSMMDQPEPGFQTRRKENK